MARRFLDQIPAQRCPCGFTRRAFATPDNQVATIHYVDIQADARTHYHKKLTEIYLILEGEGFMELDGERIPVQPMTTILIQPGYRFSVVDRLLTNFHLPKSTLLALVCAFAGQDRVLDAYATAVKERYRFFSYGDAMLLDRAAGAS